MDEKKFKLDELPDENSGSSVPKPPPPKKKPSVADPRLETLKSLDDKSRVDEMRRKWIFDHPQRLWGWIYYVGLLLLAEKIGIYEYYLREINLFNSKTMGMGGTMIEAIILYFDYLIMHPFILVVLTPIFFKFKRTSDYIFEVNFDGINTVKRINLGEYELPHRVQLKWNDITSVTKGKVKERPILILHAPSGPVGELIWDIKDDNKKALKLLMKGLIPPTHALSKFLEKEVT